MRLHTPKRLALVLCLSILGGCAHEVPQSPSPAPVVLVDALPLQGITRAQDTFALHAPTSGTLKAVHVAAGDVVQKGDVLFELDATALARAVDEADHALQSATLHYQSAQRDAEFKAALLEEAYLRIQYAQETLEKLEGLLELDAIPAQDVTHANEMLKLAQHAQTTATKAMAHAQAQAQDAKAQKARAQNALVHAQNAQKMRFIRAPNQAMVLEVNVDAGTPITPKQTLGLLGVIDPIALEFTLKADAYLTLGLLLDKVGNAPIYLTLADGSAYPQAGTLNYDGARANPDGYVVLQATFVNDAYRLRPNMQVNAHLDLGEAVGLLPLDSVQKTVQGYRRLDTPDAPLDAPFGILDGYLPIIRQSAPHISQPVSPHDVVGT